MFWEKWIPEKYLVKSVVCGLEIVVTDVSIKFFYTIIKNKNNTLTIIESGIAEDKLVLPKQVLKNKIPVMVCINGKGLISKKTTLPEREINYSDVLLQNLPAVNTNDFYIQFYPQK